MINVKPIPAILILAAISLMIFVTSFFGVSQEDEVLTWSKTDEEPPLAVWYYDGEKTHRYILNVPETVTEPNEPWVIDVKAYTDGDVERIKEAIELATKTDNILLSPEPNEPKLTYTAEELDEIYKDEPALGKLAKSLYGFESMTVTDFEPITPMTCTVVEKVVIDAITNDQIRQLAEAGRICKVLGGCKWRNIWADLPMGHLVKIDDNSETEYCVICGKTRSRNRQLNWSSWQE